jgi:hypothetical protein
MTLVIALVAIFASRPPATPQLTAIGTTDSLQLLLEGAGGGRVLIGGGGNGSELPSALGQQFLPWRGDLDLLIVADRRDLLGATELVRRGRARAVVTLGLDDDRAATAALTALRELCDGRGVPLRSLDDPERINLGADGALTIDLYPATIAGDAARLRFAAGAFSAAIVLGEQPTPDPALAAIIMRESQAHYEAASAGRPRLLIAPGSSPASGIEQHLMVGPGQRATLVLADDTLRLRGGTLTTLDAPRGPVGLASDPMTLRQVAPVQERGEQWRRCAR